MCNFSTGFLVGALMGAGAIIAVHPMNKRSMRKAYRRAERMMNRVGDTIRDWA